MKIKCPLGLTATLLVLAMFNFPLSSAQAQGTAFTYQGRLNDGNSPANGRYDLQFTLYATNVGGAAIAGPVTNSAVGVTNGLFAAAVDFGNAFNGGASNWLQIAVSTNGANAFSTLTPRQPLTPVPYAITAENVISGGLAAGSYSNAVTLNNGANQFTGSFTGSGIYLTGVNALALNGLTAGNFWQLGGNTGTTPGTQFLGTTDNKALTLKVNNTTALQIVPGTTLPNLVGGLAGTHPSVIASGVSGAVIAGGNAPSGAVSGNGGGDFQAVYDNDGTVGGGFGNKVGSDNGDLTDAAFATVAGGVFNSAAGYAATVAGGDGNSAEAQRAVIAGGYGNSTTSGLSAIGGGQGNTIQTNADYSIVAGGSGNMVQTYASRATIGGGGSNKVYSTAANATIAGGYGNVAAASDSAIGGGAWNFDNGGGTIAGGYGNFNGAAFGTIVGGYGNTNLPGSLGGLGSIGGGELNLVTNDFAAIPGGLGNVAGGLFSFAAGYQAQAVHDGTFVWADSTIGPFTSTAPNQFLIRATGGVGIGTPNPQGMLHVYSTNNPTVVRIQSSGTPGYGRVEFVSDPQGSGTEWRPGYIQSVDAGGFTGGLGFYDNGTGSASRFGSNEVMRIINGHVGIGTIAPGHLLQVGNNVSPAYCDGTTWVNGSDRNAKSGFQPVNPAEVLAKVSALPVSAWHYNSDVGTPHIGPMAQDFYAAFHVGADDRHIATVDEGGVALAAIQGLDQKLEEKAATIAEQNDRIRTQAAEIHKLEQSVAQLQSAVAQLTKSRTN